MALVTVNVETEELVDSIYDDLGNKQDKMIDFICELDERMADYEFTVALRDRLNEVLAAEDAAIGEADIEVTQ